MNNQLLNLPSLDAVRGFVAVARRMSITQAAQDLCLSQSAVSRQIQSLEEHLNTPLLIRKHRALALTEAGERLFHLASPWLSLLAEYSDSVRAAATGGRLRPVTITAGIGVTSLWLLPRVGAFQVAHPNIDVRVATSPRIMDLRQEGIDLAIRYCREADAPEGAVRLFGETVVPVASRKVAARAFKSPKALLNEVLLELDERARPWLRWSEWLEASGMPGAKPRSYLHFNQYDQIVQAAIEGHGVALGRLALVQPMLRDGRLVAQANGPMRNSDYGYWLIDTGTALHGDAVMFRDWIINAAQRDAG